MRRREVLKLFTAAALSGVAPYLPAARPTATSFTTSAASAMRGVLHMTDTHAQLDPVHFREPSVNLGIGAMAGKPPHLVGKAFLKHFGIAPEAASRTPSPISTSPRPRTAMAGSAVSPISRR